MLSRSIEQFPPVFASRFEAILRRVDFPHPDGPTTVTNSPALIPKETLSSAFVPSSKVIDTFSKTKSAEEDEVEEVLLISIVSVVLTRNKIGHS